jgi:hypothetical protein
LASRLQLVADAATSAVSRLPAADEVLLITAAAQGSAACSTGRPTWRELLPGTVISSSPLRRSDLPQARRVALATRAGDGAGARAPWDPVARTASVGTMVGAALLDDHAELRSTPTTAVEITGAPVEPAAMLAGRCASDERIAVLVIADGAACHGDHAPGRRDDRAPVFDAALADALAAGDPRGLRDACADPDLARDLLAAVSPLAVLGLLAEDRPPAAAELLYSGAPLGAGYLVASWRWGAG